MNRNWEALTSKLSDSLASLRPGQFLVIEYLTDRPCEPLPYAQAAPELDGWYCEVVSDGFLAPNDWPLDEVALRRAGWQVPDTETRNWWRDSPTAETSARLLIEGLKTGRACTDPDLFMWSVGRFPTGPRGGEPIPVPEAMHLLAA